jgi:predicted Zn-dependent protease
MAGAEARLAAAQALWHAGDNARAEGDLRELAAQYPAHEEIALALAKLLRSEGRLTAASEAIFRACRAAGFEPGQCLRGAGFMQNSERQALAADLCTQAFAHGADTAELYALAGNIARELGDFAGAREYYLAALGRSVDLDTWYVAGALAALQRYTDPAHADLPRMQAHFRDARAKPRARAASGFGLAKAHDDLGERAAAASLLREANALVRAVQPWNAKNWRNSVEQHLRERCAASGAVPNPEFVPVFIVGLPRSGTTLTATRLAQHTQARDRGESRALRFVAQTLIAGGHLGDRAALAEAAQVYHAHVRQDDDPRRFYLDSDPLNFRYLHIAAALFPQARIVHCRRDRRDTALSLWMQDFEHADCAFAYDLDDIARFAQGHDRLFAHWHATLALPIHTLDYETLVATPERALAELRAFIGMPTETVAPSDVAAIPGASMWQARQPIYSSSVGRWHAYAPYIPELAQLPRVV